MPVSLLLGLPGNESIENSHFSWLARPNVDTTATKGVQTKRPVLTSAQLVYIGLRDLDAGEKAILKQNGIKAFSMHEVDKFGIGKVVEMALDHVNPNRDLPIHLSFDVDALDPSVAPSTGTPVSVLFPSHALP
jgi:arginase